MFIFSLCTLNTGYDYDKFIEKYTAEHEEDDDEAGNKKAGSMNQVFQTYPTTQSTQSSLPAPAFNRILSH